MTLQDLQHSETWRGKSSRLPFEIHRWGLVRGAFPPMNDGRGCWNYYIYLLERDVANFSAFWLDGVVKSYSDIPGSSRYIDYDYLSSPLDVCTWHGGLTFWEQSGLDGQRVIKMGCDYNHLYDQYRSYDLDCVLYNTLDTITELLPLLRFHAK